MGGMSCDNAFVCYLFIVFVQNKYVNVLLLHPPPHKNE